VMEDGDFAARSISLDDEALLVVAPAATLPCPGT